MHGVLPDDNRKIKQINKFTVVMPDRTGRKKKGMKMTGIIPYTRPSMPPIEEYIDEIKDMWETHWLTNMGEKHRLFQDMLRFYIGAENIELLTNGHMAIELTIQAMSMPKGEIITTPFTFASTVHAIIRSGFKPVFCDIKADDFTIDPDIIENLITQHTRAILPVHVYGNVCDTDRIQEIADKYDIKIIYDAAHAFGVRYKGRSVGNFGDACCFSFHATKVFNSIEGGAVSFSDIAFGEKLSKIKNFGIKNETEVDEIGPNAKMNEFVAAMGICNLRHLDEEIEKRRNIDSKYRENLTDVKGIRLNEIRDNMETNYAYFPIIVEEDFPCSRDELRMRLLAENIFAGRRFYPLVSTLNCFNGRFDASDTPVALDISEQILLLPLYSDLTTSDVERICHIISAIE